MWGGVGSELLVCFILLTSHNCAYHLSKETCVLAFISQVYIYVINPPAYQHILNMQIPQLLAQKD